MVGEVKAANPWLGHLVARERALALDFRYHQPRLHAGAEPVRLVFYYQPVGVRRRSLAAPELRRLLYTIWRRLYRIPKPLSNTAFRANMASLKGRRRIGNKLP